MKKFLLLAAVAFVALFVNAQSKLSPFTRLYLEDMALDTAEQTASTRRLTKSMSSVNGVQMVSAFVHFYDEINRPLLESYGVVVESDFPATNVVTANIPINVMEQLSADPEIRYIEMGRPVEMRMDKARVYSDADKVHAGTAPLESPYFGKDVVVGIVDGGFQYNHAAFYDKDQKNLRVKRAWNMNALVGTPPDGYSRGAEYKTEADIIKKKYDNQFDVIGHATHVAGIAAGADHTNGNPYYGIAQESDLVFVSYGYTNDLSTGIADGVKYVFEYAESVGKPAVVNLSLGSHIGPHDGSSSFDRAIEGLVGSGRIVVGSAGNEGSDNFHVYKTFNEEDTMLHTFVRSKEGDWSSFIDGVVDIWGDCAYTIRFVIYNNLMASYGGRGYLYKSKDYSVRDLVDHVISDNPTASFDGSTIAKARISAAVEKNQYNGKYHVECHISSVTLPKSGVFLGVEIVSNEGTVHMWADNTYTLLSDNKVSGWDVPTSSYTVGEIGGTCKKIVTVGAYVSNNRNGKIRQDERQKANFSSMGPTADGRVKPEISAPGCQVVSSVPDTRAVLNGSAYDEARVSEINGVKYYYSYMQGTSMSAPYVTGTIATWLQANPNLTYDEIIDVFKKTSIRDEYYGIEIPNNNYGYGRISTYYGLLEVLGKYTSVKDVTAPASLMFYPNPTNGEFNIGFTRDDNNVAIFVYAVNGQMVYSRQLDKVAAGEDVVVDLSCVSNGAYVVKVQGTAANETYRLIVAK